jgi:predicted DCC family thiol-disulfide oxidoreductase YuxK
MNVPNPPDKPLLVFDGDCSFCRIWVARWRPILGEEVDLEPLQTAWVRFPTIPRSRFRRAVQLILPDGAVHEGAEAVFRALALAPDPSHRRWLAVYQRFPGARPVFDWGYRQVANHRPALTRVSHFLFGPSPGDDAESGPVLAVELAAARRRRIALGAGLGAALLLGGFAAWRQRRARRRLGGFGG